MVKKKGGRDMNPADAWRKQIRQKEILRNKKERRFQRDAHALKADPEAIKEELKTVINMEVEGKVNLSVRMKKKALQGALEAAAKKKKEDAFKQQQEAQLTFSNCAGHGVAEKRPEDSVYYHPTLNPEGVPPPGKPQRYRTDPTAGPTAPRPAAGLPVPAPPPLPRGPAPDALPPPPGPPPMPAGPAPLGAVDGATRPLPPPPGPPPGAGGMLPPPPGPPPGMGGADAGVGGALLPPPLGPPPGMLPLARPGMPPGFGAQLAPPPGPPPGMTAAAGAKKAPTISGASTVVKMPRAQDDRSVTAMVPASVRVRREAAPSLKPRALSGSTGPGRGRPVVGPGFGLAPAPTPAPVQAPRSVLLPRAMAAPAPAAGAVDAKYQDFMAEMASLGALGT
ncbi:hypothetical protein WJX81_003227 [Elliptochloris bilobata]|uniref:Wbp11/ELF5/Saf1 N-terminal domain-containing protein n=1 Tax=Elliptochloris bilobata TaxID=381761 RepID=A0AAW1RIJ4_9CHLO